MKLLLISVLIIISCQAQEKKDFESEPIIIGETANIYSKVLDEDRVLMIRKPNGYEVTNEKYPVLYLLDAGFFFHHTTGVIEYMIAQGRIPDMIVVGVTNTNRTRDLTPESSDDEMPKYPISGGADKFLKFFETELIPHVEKTYRTHPYRILVGHSFGGLFATHAMIEKPKLFNSYISISPSLWWSDKELVDKTEFFLKHNSDVKSELFLTLGNETGTMYSSVIRMKQVLERGAPKSLNWEFKYMPKETHKSVPIPSIYEGLSFLYSDWYMPISRNYNFLEEDQQKIVKNDGVGALFEKIEDHYKSLTERYGYKIPTPENYINHLGYLGLQVQDVKEAIRIFELNVKRFPKSANVYDSLGDAYDVDGRLEDAKLNYYKAVERAQETLDSRLSVYKRNLDRIREKIKEEKAKQKRT